MNVVGLPIGYTLTDQEQREYSVYQLIAMVIEGCKYKWKTDGNAVYHKLKDSGIINYLTNGYDYLHTQSLDYIIIDVEEMVKAYESLGGKNAV